MVVSVNKSAVAVSREAPAVISFLSDIDTPVSVYQKLSAVSESAFLLESAQGDSRIARYSFIGVDPLLTISLCDGKASIKNTTTGTVEERPFSNPLQVLQEIIHANTPAAALDGLPFPFSGGLVGYMSYAATKYFEGIAQQPVDPYGIPEAYYGLYDSAVVFDHQYRRLSIISYRGRRHAQELAQRVRSQQSLPVLYASADSAPQDDVYENVQTRLSKSEFLGLVRQSKELIEAGEVFQIVVAQRFSLPVKAAALDIYRLLQSINPSPYAYFLKMPGFAYVGASPETFVRCNNGQVMLRAIAGTRPRGQSEAEDVALESELISNEKELAEHRMLVDLGRNDLGKISKVGSVQVGKIAELMKFSHVMHLGTEVSGQLASGKTCFDAFASCFPRGTVCGAPKVRAMQHLSKLEPETRGIYSGVVGYFDFCGKSDGAIAIRSALIKEGMAHVTAGAGIVLDSDPEAEYEETRNKARSVIKAIKLANEVAQ